MGKCDDFKFHSDDCIKIDNGPVFDELLRDARIDVRYKWGRTTAGAGTFTLPMAEQVLEALNPIVMEIWGKESAVSITGYSGEYRIMSRNGVEGYWGKTPRQAMAESYIVVTALRRYIERSTRP